MRGRVTISRRGALKGGSTMVISIEDDASGIKIVEVEMSPKEFAECITGIAYCAGEIKFAPTSEIACNYGKTKETKRVTLNGSFKYNKDRSALDDAIEEHLVDGWELWSDGMSTQQNVVGKHSITLYRYVD